MSVFETILNEIPIPHSMLLAGFPFPMSILPGNHATTAGRGFEMDPYVILQTEILGTTVCKAQPKA